MQCHLFSPLEPVPSSLLSKMINVMPVLIAQLMIQSELIDTDRLKLKQVLDRKVDNNSPGESLFDFLGEEELKAVLITLKLLRRSLISFEQAVEALSLIKKENYPFQAALAKARWLHMQEEKFPLAGLLFEAEVIELFDLGRALALTIDGKTVFGKALCQANKLEHRVRTAAIEAVSLGKCGLITKKHAIAIVRAAARTDLKLKDLLGINEGVLRAAGKELVFQGRLNPEQLIDIVEASLETEQLWIRPIRYERMLHCLKQIVSLTVSKMEESQLPALAARAEIEDLLLSREIKKALASGDAITQAGAVEQASKTKPAMPVKQAAEMKQAEAENVLNQHGSPMHKSYTLMSRFI